MYWILYSLGVRAYSTLIWFFSFFNSKARRFVEGRKLQDNREVIHGGIWVHVSSLGEFEQARPLIERIRQETNKPIILTFFSPSGYEIRKNYDKVDRVLYMQIDTYRNAQDFIDKYQFSIAVFVKYDFWMNHLRVCLERGIPVLFISVMLRSEQVYFNIGKRFYMPIFKKIDHFFVQNQATAELLTKHQIPSNTQVGDTRVDRVTQIAQNANSIVLFDSLETERKLFVVGSAWESDRILLAPLFEKYREHFQFVIAPHDISQTSILKIMEGFSEWVLYSEWNGQPDFDYLIIDNIGMLASLYAYADYTYVGGAFKGTLHNTLEAAAHGKPVFFGRHPKNSKFKEAKDLVVNGAGFSEEDFSGFSAKLDRLLLDQAEYQKACLAATNYIKSQSGATEMIYRYMEKYLR